MLARLAFLFACTLFAAPVFAQDGTVSELLARVQRLEGQTRTLTGEVEQLTNLLKRSQEEFKRYRDDTESRLQALEGGKPAAPARRSDVAPPGNAPAVANPPRPAHSDQTGPPPVTPRTATGAPPRTLDELAAEAAGDTGMDLDSPETAEGGDDEARIAGPPGMVGRPAADPSHSSLTPPGLPGVAVDMSGPRPAQPGQPASDQDLASLQQTPEEEYTADYRLIEAKNYEAAELAFRKFITTHPKDKRVADATHWVGESLFQRQQYRDAAEQFLKVTKDHQKSRRAPSSMLRLGTSLAALGEKEAACATFQEVGRRYPDAGPTVKTGVDKEMKRNGC